MLTINKVKSFFLKKEVIYTLEQRECREIYYVTELDYGSSMQFYSFFSHHLERYDDMATCDVGT